MERNEEAREPDAFEAELLAWLHAEAAPDTSWVQRHLKDGEFTESPWDALPENPGALSAIPEVPMVSAPEMTTQTGSDTPSKTGASTFFFALNKASSQKSSLVTEEQANVRKLASYLQQHGGPAVSTPTETVLKKAPSEWTPEPRNGQEVQPVVEDGRTSKDVKPTVATESSTAGGRAPSEPAQAFVFGRTSMRGGSVESGWLDFSDSSGGREPGQQPFFSQLLNEAPKQTAASSQLSAGAKKLLAEAQARSWGPNLKVPVELRLDEAQVPLRLRFTPNPSGQHEVSLVVRDAKAKRELRRVLPEIESALTELPIQVSEVDIRVEADPASSQTNPVRNLR